MIDQQAQKLGKDGVLVSREPVGTETYLDGARAIAKLAIDDVLIKSPNLGFPGETNTQSKTHEILHEELVHIVLLYSRPVARVRHCGPNEMFDLSLLLRSAKQDRFIEKISPENDIARSKCVVLVEQNENALRPQCSGLHVG